MRAWAPERGKLISRWLEILNTKSSLGSRLVRRFAVWRRKQTVARLPLPIFVISFNRGAMLRRVYESYQKQNRQIRLVVHDNGSDDPTTLAILALLKSEGVEVYRYGKINDPNELNLVDLTVQDFAMRKRYHGNYIVTDCDIDMSTADPAALDVYQELLQQFPEVDCVGPMLRISDIPKSYMLFAQVMKRHIDQFWHREPEWVTTSWGRVAVLRAPIDTTFALYRGGKPFRREQNGLRVYAPFEARHLDWYPDAESPAEYRLSSSPAISHWNNAEYAMVYGNVDHSTDAARTYRVILQKEGQLTVAQRSTMDNPV